MPLGWIKVEDFSFNALLLFERFQIRLMMDNWNNWDEARKHLGIALAYNPAVRWYLPARCPECAPFVESVVKDAPQGLTAEAVRRSEVFVMEATEDFVIYTQPALMDTHCDFIYAWDEARLFEMADLTGKVVLDVGSGSGRLAFAAAKKARMVYASEPVDMLREYLRDKIEREHITNLRVCDGMADGLPFPDDTFDIVMSGHVVGDDVENELAELTRVVKHGGWILDCPGEDSRKSEYNGEWVKKGWEEWHYVSTLGGDVYRYRKQVEKA